MRPPRWRLILISLIVTAGLALVAALPAAPRLARWWQNRQHLDALRHGDGEAYRSALQFTARVADDRPRYRDAVVTALPALDPPRYRAAVRALDFAGVWSRSRVGDDAWLRHVANLARAPDAATRVVATQALAELTDLAADPRVAALARTLARDDQARVRINALTAIAKLAARRLDPFRETVLNLTQDPQNAVARRAAIIAALLHLDPQTPGPDDPRLARYLEDPRALAAELGVRGAAFDLPGDAAADRLRGLLSSADPAVREVTAAYAVQRFDEDELTRLARGLMLDFNADARLGGAILAGLGGLRPAGIAGGLASVLAEQEGLSRDAVLEMDDAALAQLGLARIDLLHVRFEQEDHWPRRQVYRLALWMRGDQAADLDAGAARQLLLRDDVPKSTVLLALMERGHVDAALRWLFNPAGEPPIDLDDLLATRRWWHVLRGYLPDDAPPVWPQAPPTVRRYQYDVLREWVLIHTPASVP